MQVPRKNVVNREAKQMQGGKDKIKKGTGEVACEGNVLLMINVLILSFSQTAEETPTLFTGPPSVLRLPSPRGQSWALR